MQIYVQSCEYSPDDDYSWQPEIPAIIKQKQVNHLIQSESPSIVLARYQSNLLLLLTGLEANERKDFRGRKIRNSVAIVCDDFEQNEIILRALTVRALRGSLRDDIDQAVKCGGEYGFDYSSLSSEYIQQLALTEKFESDSAHLGSKIGRNSQKLQESLADELTKCCLPKEDFSNAPLVVVTGIKSESVLVDEGVWRGLSNLVQGEGWKDLHEQILPEAGVENNQGSEQKDKNLILMFFFVLLELTPIVIVIAIMYLLLFQPQPQSQPQPKQETQSSQPPTPGSVQPLQSSSQQSQLPSGVGIDE